MAGAEGKKKLITLRSSDGDQFEVEEVVAMESQIIRHMIEDDCADNGIPLPNVNSKILSRVIEYCIKHVRAAGDNASTPPTFAEDLENWDAEFVKVDQSTLLGLIMAASSGGPTTGASWGGSPRSAAVS